MKYSRYRTITVGLGMIVLLCVLTYAPFHSGAALVWSDDFNDLNIDDWFQVSCTAEDGSLRGYVELDIDPPTPIAYHPSTVATGTWKFDLTEIGEWGEELDLIHIYFIQTDIQWDNSSYYALVISHGWVNTEGTIGKTFVMELAKQYQDGIEYTLATYTTEPRFTQVGVLYQFAITRTTSGEMSVYVNGTHAMSAVDNDLTFSEHFGFYSWRDYSLDNIEVYNSIEIGGLPVQLIALGVAIPIVIIAALVFLKRKS